jgi:hypothetical protein
MSVITSFSRLEIHFDTETLPAPFSHRYTLVIEKSGDSSLIVDLNLEYYGREELSDEDILDEGFTDNDNYRWNGKLPLIWTTVINDKLQVSNWKKKADDQNSNLFLRINHSQGSEMLWPADKRQWETFAQELIQAIFELGKKEAPLKIEFLNIENVQRSYSIEYKFAERTVSISTSEKNQNPMDWHEGQRLLKYIFSFDYLPEVAIDKPKKPGNYISPGDGLWYELSEAAQKGDSEKLQRLVETLKGYL